MGTVPTGLPLSMATVRAQLGGTAGTTQLSAYVRGGAYVPSYPANSGVPTAVPITLSQLQGATNVAPFTASASPSSVSGNNPTSGVPGTAVSNASTVSTSGGAGTKTYAWSRVSGDTVTVATSPTNVSTTFSALVNGTNSHRVSTWQCVVTDSVSGTATTNTVTVTLDFV